MSDTEHASARRDDESEKARLDRELIELLNEIRVALPGVQVLFAFLLAVPFQSRFGSVTAFQEDVYFVALCSALFATILLITPSAYHRANFRKANKQRIVFRSNWLVLAGIAVLGMSMTAVMLLITDVIFDRSTAVLVTTISGLLFCLLWIVLPVSDHLRHGRET